MSASSMMMAADLPPSSNVVRLSCSPQSEAMRRPAVGEPVKAILSVPRWVTRCSPTSRPAGTMFNTPGGSSASMQTSANRYDVMGASGAGLSTMVQPAAMAGASFMTVNRSGEFQGTIAPTTPTGRRFRTVVPSMPSRVSWNGKVRASPA